MKNMEHARAVARGVLERLAAMEARRIKNQLRGLDRYDLIDHEKASALITAFEENSGDYENAEQTVTQFKTAR